MASPPPSPVYQRPADAPHNEDDEDLPSLELSPSPLPSVVPARRHVSLASIKQDMDTLVHGDVVDKTTALEITRLFFELETLLIQEKHARIQETTTLRNEVEMARMRAELDRLARRQTLDAIHASTSSSQNVAVQHRRR